MRSKFTTLFLLLSILSCKSDQSSDQFNVPNIALGNSIKIKQKDVVSLNIIENDKEVFLSQFFSLEKIIPLETISSSFLGGIDKVIKTNQSLFILDRDNTKNLLQFNLDGKFIRSVGSNGDGPENYNGIVDFAIDDYNKTILIFDRLARLYIFDFQGRFIEKQYLNIRGNNVDFVEPEVLAIFSNKGSNSMPIGDKKLKLYNYKLKIFISKHIDVNIELNNKILNSPQNIFTSQKETILFPFDTDTVYRLDENSLHAQYLINHTQNPLPDDFYSQLPPLPQSIKLIEDSNYPSTPIDWFENDKYILFSYRRGKSRFRSLITKDNFIPTFTTTKIIDDFYIGVALKPVGHFDGNLLCTIRPEFLNQIKEYYKDEINEKWKSLNDVQKKKISTIKRDDNQALIVLKLK